MEPVDDAVLATERYGSQETWKYRLSDGVMKRERQGEGSFSRGSSITAVFKSIFLPQGYPESVSEDYVQYQVWDTVQAFSSSLSGTLATQASLKGVGVGNQDATVAAATITWLLRDGTGMLGRILFAWLKGSKLDSEAKKWRLFADILNDIAMFIEILAPYYPPLFTLIICIAGVFKSIVGVAGGATRAALTVHQARRNNMADISAKDGSQVYHSEYPPGVVFMTTEIVCIGFVIVETLVNLAGLLVSLVLIPLVTDNPWLTFVLFFLFTSLHLFANYKAVRSVVMETLNEARLSIVLHQYLTNGRVLSPQEANQREPVFLELHKEVPIKLGVSLRELTQSPQDLQMALKNNNNKSFLIGIQQGCVCVCLASDASVDEEIEAACQAVCLSSVLTTSSPPQEALKQLSVSRSQDPWILVSESYKFMDKIFKPFLRDLKEARWLTDRTLLDWNEWRVDWKKKMS